MKELATSIFTFEDLRKRNFLYVDKTRYVWNLVNGGKVYFLSRPRRFGKSLLLSTFKAYFEGKRELFVGLEIEKLKTDEWEKFPVIHLDLASGSSKESYEVLMTNWKHQLQMSYEELGIEFTDGKPGWLLADLINKAHKKYGKEVVVLIDEYDKPILDSMFKPYIDKVMDVMSDFYQELKSANQKERFVFITGVTKFAHVSLFSGANNPYDLTNDKEYATMLGYTEEELRDYFAEHISATASELDATQEEILEEMKLWYNGTRFVRNTPSVYNPVSVGCFLRKKDFRNYWESTGTPRILLEKIKRTPFRLRDFSANWRDDNNDRKYEISRTSVEDLAIQTGYLCIAEWMQADKFRWRVRYDFPNKEIRDCWYSNIVTLSTGYEDELWRPLMDNMCDALNAKDLDALMTAVANFFSGIPYENVGEVAEGYFRNQLHTLFTLFGIPNQCEVQQASQRADIVAQTRKMAVVFEVKMLAREADGDEKKVYALLNEAKKQAREKGYADRYRNESEMVKTVAVVFDQGTRKMVRWGEVES